MEMRSIVFKLLTLCSFYITIIALYWFLRIMCALDYTTKKGVFQIFSPKKEIASDKIINHHSNTSMPSLDAGRLSLCLLNTFSF